MGANGERGAFRWRHFALSRAYLRAIIRQFVQINFSQNLIARPTINKLLVRDQPYQ